MEKGKSTNLNQNKEKCLIFLWLRIQNKNFNLICFEKIVLSLLKFNWLKSLWFNLVLILRNELIFVWEWGVLMEFPVTFCFLIWIGIYSIYYDNDKRGASNNYVINFKLKNQTNFNLLSDLFTLSLNDHVIHKHSPSRKLFICYLTNVLILIF